MNNGQLENIDLCQSLLAEMRNLDFKPSALVAVENSHYFARANGQDPTIQRPYLVLLLNSIFLQGPEVVPSNIRLALNVAHDHQGWLVDLKIVLLPFLKANQDKFFN